MSVQVVPAFSPTVSSPSASQSPTTAADKDAPKLKTMSGEVGVLRKVHVPPEKRPKPSVPFPSQSPATGHVAGQVPEPKLNELSPPVPVIRSSHVPL